MLTQNAKINAVNKTKVYCVYDELAENNYDKIQTSL